jgi:hypothetical protein
MTMKIDRIQPAGMNVRIQQGKPAYSHVVTVTGPGKTIYIAGQLARDAEGNIVGPGDIRAQLVRQLCDGGPRRQIMYLETVDSVTSKPSCSNSPWMRGAPHNGFSLLIRRISSRSSRSTLGRPTRPRDFQRQ